MRCKAFLAIDALFWTLVVIAESLSVTLSHKSEGGIDWKEKKYASIYLAASKFTDPLCTSHQYLRQTLLIEPLYPLASSLEKRVRKSLYYLGSAAHACGALFTTLPGIELRFFAKYFQEKPFIYFKGQAEEMKTSQKSLSLLSWNVCCVSGGYSITDGGVMPWQHRIKQVTDAIGSQGADIICLYEIFDIQTALQLFRALSTSYAHFYFNIGPRVVGLSSGLFVASRVAIANPEFIPFPVETNDGRSKHCKKGFFSFDVTHIGQKSVRIYATHLQHSEFPECPTEGEILARKLALELILHHMNDEKREVCILTGDLNLEEHELEASGWGILFNKGNILGSGKTWGGDMFCSTLSGKPVSGPLNLDHTLYLSNAAVALTTSYVETGFDGTHFLPGAISDHKGLLSTITFPDVL